MSAGSSPTSAASAAVDGAQRYDLNAGESALIGDSVWLPADARE